MITPMQMYWLLKLDDIYVAFSVAVVLSILVLMGSTVILCASFEAGDVKIYKPARISVLVSLLSAILFSCAVTFLPTTKQMAAIYVVPAIANNEKIQQIGGKTLDISNQLLDLTKE
ncbi:hypothetical protein [Candidatus Avelusimicrobium fimicolum]|uniref:hypothetical protein n=1 Tax=Candidatus Avelusimicrobium fimicolum TaxID=3416216 RepID=UPI003D119963